MYDFAFDARSFERELISSDFTKHPELLNPEKRAAIISDAQRQASTGFDALSLHRSNMRSATLYQPKQLAQKLVLRKLSRNIRHLTRVRQSDRDTVIKSLKAILSEGHKYRVYKLDIRRFYETIDPGEIAELFRQDSGFPPTSLFVFESLAFHLESLGITGLPRGMAISATLSEYVMRNFDRVVRAEASVYYYARYVDDANNSYHRDRGAPWVPSCSTDLTSTRLSV